MFTTPIATVLLPAFSKINPEKENENLCIIFRGSAKYTALLTLPVIMVIMVLSRPLVFTLLGTSYEYAPFFLTLYFASFLFSGFGNLSMANFLNGIGETKTTMKLSLLRLAVGLPLGLILIYAFGVVGAVITIFLIQIPSLIVGLLWIRNHYNATIDLSSSAKIFLSALISALIVHIFLLYSPFQPIYSDWMILFIGGVLFLIVYVLSAPLLGAVSKDDLESLKEMFKGFGPISWFIGLLLGLLRKIVNVQLFCARYKHNRAGQISN